MTSSTGSHPGAHTATISLARSRAVVALVLLLTMATSRTIVVLQMRSASSREAEVKLAGVKVALDAPPG